MGALKTKPPTRREQVDAVRLKAAGQPAHINAREARLLAREMPEAAGPVITQGLLARAGRGHDNRITNLIPAESALLKRHGGSGAVNPRTGLVEYDDSDDDGNTGNTSNAGENTGGMSGAPGSGVSGPQGDGTGRGDGPGETGNYGTGQGNYGYDAYSGGLLGSVAYDPTTMPSIESLLSTPSGFRAPGYEDMSMVQYSPPDTLGRLIDTFRYGPPQSYRELGQVPGRYGAPTGRGLGFAGTLAGMLTPGMPMGALMGLGMRFDQAMSPGTRASSLAENQAQGGRNSTGNDRDSFGSPAAGSSSGAATAGLLDGARKTASPSQTAALAEPGVVGGSGPGSVSLETSGGRQHPGVAPLIESILADYIWRGRSGSGW
jgi:hypothetical protein